MRKTNNAQHTGGLMTLSQRNSVVSAFLILIVILSALVVSFIFAKMLTEIQFRTPECKRLGYDVGCVDNLQQDKILVCGKYRWHESIKSIGLSCEEVRI